MDRILRQILSDTPAGRAYLERMDAAKKAKRARHAPSRKARDAKRAAKKIRRAEVRAACVQRAGEDCEACHDYSDALHLDHFWGRAREESVESCWMLCPECDRDKTENRPSRQDWLAWFGMHCRTAGYREQIRRVEVAMALERAQHPETTR